MTHLFGFVTFPPPRRDWRFKETFVSLNSNSNDKIQMRELISMKTTKKFKMILGLGLLTISLGCETPNKPAATTPTPVASPSTAVTAPTENTTPATTDAILATLNGQPITDSEVSAEVKDQLKKVESQIFEIKRGALDDIIEQKLIDAEAAKKKVSADDLLKKEIDSKIKEPTPAEIQSFYDANKPRFKNRPLDEVKPDVINQLKQSGKMKAYNAFVDTLRKTASIKVNMKRPRIEVSVDTDASKGSAKAPITLVEFSDFQCPFCKRARDTVKQIIDTYGNKVHYVFRDFPLSFHQQAHKAAEAAECAGEQGKYWEYNAKLFDAQGAQDVDHLKQYAKEFKLNSKKFDDCLDSGKMSAEVDKDAQEGSKAGVTGTPAYFINGIFVSGAQPFEKFKSIIDEELANQ